MSYSYIQRSDAQRNLQQLNDPAPPYRSQQDTLRNNDVEMGTVGEQRGRYNAPRPAQDSDAILNECRQIDIGIGAIEQYLERLSLAQRRALNDTATDQNSPSTTEIDSLNTNIMSEYRALLKRMTWIKGRPESEAPRNRNQIGLMDRKLRSTYQRYRTVENEYQRRMREQSERQYRIVRPDATEQEVREACEDPNQQIFSQALMRSDRRGESRQVLSAVRDRHEAIQKIESQMIELAQLFTDMETMVVQQDAVIQNVEQKGEETNTHMVEANVQLKRAGDSAQAARRKKWWCLLIALLIVIVIVIIVVVVVLVLRGKQ